MPLFNFLRRLFDIKDKDEWKHERFDDPQSGTHSFRNPIWQNDDDENDDDDFRHFGNRTHFSIFTDPMEITRYFESQLDEILKGFFPGSDHGKFFSFPGSGNVPEIPSTEQSQDNLRVKVLKPGYDVPKPYEYGKSNTDADLDGKISAEDFTQIWNEPDSKKNITSFTNPNPQFRQNSRFAIKIFVSDQDGIIEERKIIRDSEGNEETIVSKQIGDKKYVNTIKKDKNGVKTKTEDLTTINKSEITDFDQKWRSPLDSYNKSGSIFTHFPWEKFFEPNPKL